MSRTRSWVGAGATAAVLAFAVSASADTGLVAEWPFDEGGGTTAADASGHGNGGTLIGGAQWVPGHGNGTALTFDGSGGRVQVPRSASLEAAAVTVSAWVRRSGSPGAFRYLVAKGATGCLAASYGLYTGPDGGLMFYVAAATATPSRAAPTPAAVCGTGAGITSPAPTTAAACACTSTAGRWAAARRSARPSATGCRPATTSPSAPTAAAAGWTSTARSTIRRSGRAR